MSPEDLMTGPTADEILKTPQYGADGQEKQQLAPMERYYERMIPSSPQGKTQARSKNEDLFGTSRKSNPRDERGCQRRFQPPQRGQGKRPVAQ